MKYYEVLFRISAPGELVSDVCDVVAALAGETGFESFTPTPTGICGYVQQDAFKADALDALLAQLPFGESVSVSYEVVPADEADWNAPWEKEGFEPVWVNDLLVVHDGRHLPIIAAAGDGNSVIQVEIDAKMAFGTGNHQTTRLMCNSIMTLELSDKTMLDCGTGTGILAIVALKRGARRAVGYDIDDWSAINAMHNAVLNRVNSRMTVYQGDASILDKMDEPFDVVMANINRNILLADIPRFARALRPGGTLLLSGFYTADAAMLEQRAAACGLLADERHEEDGWACLKLHKPKVAEVKTGEDNE